MPQQPRDMKVVVLLESKFKEIIDAEAVKADKSASAYVRDLIVKDLIDRDVLTIEDLHEILLR